MVVVAKLEAIGVLIASLEYLFEPKHLRDEGLMSWSVGATRSGWLSDAPFGPLLDAVLRYPRVLGLISIRALLLAVLLCCPPSALMYPWVLGSLTIPVAAVACLMMVRNNFGQDGADNMATIVFVAFALACVAPTRLVRSACLWFVALQSCLSYATAGMAKASAAHWRDGVFLVKVMGTETYGHPATADFLIPRPKLTRWVARSMIAWESSFPLVLFLPVRWAVAALAVGVLFHLANALFMGLNTFFWSFVGTYPAILYCVQSRGW
jgi:hypothetical protein